MIVTWPSGTAPDMWKALEDIFQPDDGLSDMQMEEDLHALKFTKKEEPKQLALRIAKISMRYKKPLTDKKKAAHIMRLGKAHYADVLCAEERACQRQSSRSCTSKEILECMTSAWKMRGGIPNEGSNGKSADELALANLQKKGGFKGNCHKCGKPGHKSAQCKVENPKGPKTNNNGEKPTCAFCG